MLKKALIVVTSNDKLGNSGMQTGWYLSEVSHVYSHLKDSGFVIDIASPKGGIAPVDKGSLKMDDPINKYFAEQMISGEGIPTVALSGEDPENYQVIYLAGGHGTMWDFPDDQDLQNIIKSIYERNGIVAAVCHGPAGLVNVKLSDGSFLVEGKEMTSFTDNEEREVGKDDVVPFMLQTKLQSQGAHFIAGKNWENKVIICERLITGQNPQSATSLAHAIVEQYNKLGENLRYQADDGEASDIWPV
ncbi:MAG: type 1 glutamine amidotransferase domain-containing protein [Bdellovibrionales bacterium]|nr:type 1 glutamine amidotransferase domain-containing protein [Bdellovibrionales bacterium]